MAYTYKECKPQDFEKDGNSMVCRYNIGTGRPGVLFSVKEQAFYHYSTENRHSLRDGVPNAHVYEHLSQDGPYLYRVRLMWPEVDGSYEVGEKVIVFDFLVRNYIDMVIVKNTLSGSWHAGQNTPYHDLVSCIITKGKTERTGDGVLATRVSHYVTLGSLVERFKHNPGMRPQITDRLEEKLAQRNNQVLGIQRAVKARFRLNSLDSQTLFGVDLTRTFEYKDRSSAPRVKDSFRVNLPGVEYDVFVGDEHLYREKEGERVVSDRNIIMPEYLFGYVPRIPLT